MSEDATSRRTIQTFVRRSSTLTKQQHQGLELYADWRITTPSALTSPALFGNDHPLTLEIGFGMGHSLVAMAAAERTRNFLGIEVHRPGLAQICYEAGTRQLDNLRVLEGDALALLRQYGVPASLDRLQLFFPDPWPKKRHHKRRLVHDEHVALLRSYLRPGGVFHMATDWQPYAEWMLAVMEQAPGYVNLAGAGNFHPRPATRPLTKFEQRGLQAGHGIWDLLYARHDEAPPGAQSTS